MAAKSNADMWQCDLKSPSQRLINMRKRNLFTDCKFQVEGKIFYAHRNVLAMSSPVFEAMFFGSFPQDNNKDPISIDDLDAKTFEFILNYIYENDVQIKSVKEAAKVLYAATKYILTELQSKCCVHLKSLLTRKNVFEIYELASMYDAKGLQDACLDVFKTHANDVLRECNYKNVNLDMLLSLIKLPNANCTDLVKFEAIEKYIKANNIPIDEGGISAQCKVTPNEANDSSVNMTAIKIFDAIKSLNFLKLNTTEFTNGPALSNLLSDKEKLAILVNITNPNAKLPLPEGFCTNQGIRQVKQVSQCCYYYDSDHHSYRDFDKEWS